MVPNRATAKSETIVLLFGCLMVLLWLPGLALNRGEGVFGRAEPEVALAETLMQDVFAGAVAAAGDPVGRTSSPSAGAQSGSVYALDGRFSLIAPDGSRVELVFPAGWAAANLVELMWNSRPAGGTSSLASTAAMPTGTSNAMGGQADAPRDDSLSPVRGHGPSALTTPLSQTIPRQE